MKKRNSIELIDLIQLERTQNTTESKRLNAGIDVKDVSRLLHHQFLFFPLWQRCRDDVLGTSDAADVYLYMED